MAWGYGIRTEHGNTLAKSPDFNEDRVVRRVDLSGGMTLEISGDSDPSLLQGLLDEERAANQAKERFLSSMSHDIRTPMNAIVGMTALAKNHLDEKSRVLDALDKIETASMHLLNLINDVLDMSRINSGRMQLQTEAFELSELLHDIMIMVSPQVEKKGHTLRLETGEIAHERLCGDALRLRQVFVNIISNAVKYTADGGNIGISVSVHDLGEQRAELAFVCTDNGFGMTEEFLRKIYEPFERLHTSQTAQIEGTGLGMSIVRRIVESMEGTISIESEVGKGTRVEIRLPMGCEDRETEHGKISGRRFLILEADTDIQEKYAQYLSGAGIAFTLASSFQESLSMLTEAGFREEPYDCIVIGSRVIDSTGPLDLAAYFHKAHPELVLVLASHDSWEKLEYQAGQVGIRVFLPLPFFRASLIRALTEAMSDSGHTSGGDQYPDMQGRHILLVEDNAINSEITREILSVTGAQVDTAENGREAVDAYLGHEEGYYTVILMDVQMPVMDGYEATAQIRSSGRGDAETVPVYAMTANTFAEDIRRAKDSGMNGHLAKPVEIGSLMQVLRSLI